MSGNKGRFALGAVIGAVAGIIAGVLTAPKPGKQTRSDLKHKAAELKDGAAKKADNLKHRAEDAADDYRYKKEAVKKAN